MKAMWKRSQKLAITMVIMFLFIPTVAATQSPPVLIKTPLPNPTAEAGSTLQFNVTILNFRSQETWISNISVLTDLADEGNLTSPILLGVDEQYNTSIALVIPLNASIGTHRYTIRVVGNSSSSPFGVFAEDYFEVTPAPTPAPTDNPTTNPTSNPINTPTATPTSSPIPPTASPTQNTTPNATPVPTAPDLPTTIFLPIFALMLFSAFVVKLKKKHIQADKLRHTHPLKRQTLISTINRLNDRIWD